MQYLSENIYRYFCTFLILASLLAVSACGGFKSVVSTSPSDQGEPQLVIEKPDIPRTVNLSDVEEAYNNGYWQLAELLAKKYVNRSGLSSRELALGWRVLALSAVENQRPRAAGTALDRWRLGLEGADASREWQQAWYNMLLQMPLNESIKQAEKIIAAGESRPASLQREAKIFIVEQRFVQGNGRDSIPELIDLYESAVLIGEKRELEQRTWKMLHRAERRSLARLMAYTNDDNERKYPFGLIRLENARRMFWDIQNQGQARENVQFLRDGSQLVDRSLFSTWNQPDYSPLKKVRVRNNDIALVLPLSGQYGNLSEKILRGAEAARRGLELSGQTLRIHVIDSDQPNWLLDLNNLPNVARIVGGPMRIEDYNAVKSVGLTDKLFFFSFLPRMDEADEGRIAWRFFSSREDQVRVMLDYAEGLGLKDYAIFAPDQGEYAQGMFDLFYYQAAERDLYITRAGYYPSSQYQLWVKSVADFLSHSDGITEEDAAPQPDLGFEAMFLPDNWSNSSRIISHVFYAMENNILFLGTNLWEHGLAEQRRLATRNFRLAVFPGVWNQQTLSPSGQLVRSSAALGGKYNADLWFSLGYDFALAAASLDLPDHAKADDVNTALLRLPRLPWSGAPIKWDKDGFAQQDLFVLTPAENGFVLANKNSIQERLKNKTNADEMAPEDAPVTLKPEEQLPKQ